MSEAHRVIAVNVRRLRQDAGLSQSHLADNSGIAKSTISRVESGQGGISKETLEILAKFLSVTLEDLLDTGHGVKLNPPLPRYAQRKKRPIAKKSDQCSAINCRNQTAPELADFLGHNILGHRALNALVGYTEVRTPADLKKMPDSDLWGLPNVGISIIEHIRACVARQPLNVDPSSEADALIVELVEGERVYHVRRTRQGFSAKVSPNGEQWYEVEIAMKFKETTKPETWHIWEQH